MGQSCAVRRIEGLSKGAGCR